MMEIKYGNLLIEVKSGIVVHGCNAQGVMGAGFAAQVRSLYPDLYRKYQVYCHQSKGTVKGSALGEVFWYDVSKELVIANAMTQLGFDRNERQTDYEAVATCFEIIGQEAIEREMEIHFPLIGAGLGGGNWNIISTIIKETLNPLDVPYTLWRLP